MRGSFLLWHTPAWETFVWCPVSARKLLALWTVMLHCDVLNCHFTVLDGKLVPTGLVYPSRVNPSPQTTPSYSCCTVPEPFQGRVVRVLHLSVLLAQGWSTSTSSAKGHTELQMKYGGVGKHVDNTRRKMGRGEGRIMQSHTHLNFHNSLSTEFYHLDSGLTLHCEQRKSSK